MAKVPHSVETLRKISINIHWLCITGSRVCGQHSISAAAAWLACHCQGNNMLAGLRNVCHGYECSFQTCLSWLWMLMF